MCQIGTHTPTAVPKSTDSLALQTTLFCNQFPLQISWTNLKFFLPLEFFFPKTFQADNGSEHLGLGYLSVGGTGERNFRIKMTFQTDQVSK